MIDRTEKIDRFDAYVNGELTQEEQLILEDEMQVNEQLKEEYELYKSSIDIIELNSIRDEVGKVMTKKGKRKVNWVIPVSIAASLLIVTLFFIGNRQPDTKQFFLRYYEPYPNVITSTRSSTLPQSKAWSAYTDEEFGKALNYFENSTPQQDTLMFYSGLCYLSLAQPNQALEKFNSIDTESIFQQQVLWYKGMAFLLMDSTDSANTLLTRIKPGEFQYNSASEIISQLKE